MNTELEDLRLLSLAEVAHVMGLSYETVRRMAKRRELPIVSIGKRAYVPVCALRSWLIRQSEVNDGSRRPTLRGA